MNETFVKKTIETWSLERQARLTAGTALLASILLAYSLSSNWIILTTLISLGMVISAFTKDCALISLISQLPWNKKSDTNNNNSSNKGAL